jgi:hypothetical protein
MDFGMGLPDSIGSSNCVFANSTPLINQDLKYEKQVVNLFIRIFKAIFIAKKDCCK